MADRFGFEVWRYRTSRFSAPVSNKEATIDTTIIARHPGAPPTGRTSAFPMRMPGDVPRQGLELNPGPDGRGFSSRP